MSNENNRIDLLKEITSVETDAISDEQEHAHNNYQFFESELKQVKAKIPYPNVSPYDYGIDYEDISDLTYKKSANRPFLEECENLKQYLNNDELYAGHVQLQNGTDYFIMDTPYLPSKSLSHTPHSSCLINVDDQTYSDIIHAWRYPTERKDIRYSRNVDMVQRQVTNVDIVLDRSSTVFSEVTDIYLRKALVRNKNRTGVVSIIQTIQHKQNEIRSLPAETSFIVQGCAGSGKTMVLMHRLRYLLYNSLIDHDSYIYLIPSNEFKLFIQDISEKFSISLNHITSYQSYYQSLVESNFKNPLSFLDEQAFPSAYLQGVYSKPLIQRCYRTFFSFLISQANDLIESYEYQLNYLMETESKKISDQYEEFNKKSLSEIQKIVEPILPFIELTIKNATDITSYSKVVVKKCAIAETKYSAMAETPNRTISPDDERLLKNEALVQAKIDLEKEKEFMKKAPIFTAGAHKAKLADLEKYYESLYSYVIQKLLQSDQLLHEKKLEYLQERLLKGVSIDSIKSVHSNLLDFWKSYSSTIGILEHQKSDVSEQFAQRYSAQIEELNNFIAKSASISENCEDCVASLSPYSNKIEEIILNGVGLVSHCASLFSSDKYEEMLNKCNLFRIRSIDQLRSALHTKMFSICKKTVSDLFKMKPSKTYKHYWYLSLYCKYLTRGIIKQKYSYIFSDEAQDLSLSEIELIKKINVIEEKTTTARIHEPIFNLFGDVNQMISSYGIRDWNDISFIPNHYTLNENFRNTNQIVDFCNQSLPFTMQKVGVDMEQVSEYSSFDQTVLFLKNTEEILVFIVKDEYAQFDLNCALKQIGLSENTKIQIFTTTAVKGLEFREVFVIDRDMTPNEAYISYTRALVKLYVIHSLPRNSTCETIQIYQEDDE